MVDFEIDLTPPHQEAAFTQISQTMMSNPEFLRIIERAMGELIGISWAEDVMGENRRGFLVTPGPTHIAIQRIGVTLNDTGGLTLMQFVAEAIRGLLRHPSDSRSLEFAWHGIGEWRC